MVSSIGGYLNLILAEVKLDFPLYKDKRISLDKWYK
jgi:hypothetical protein